MATIANGALITRSVGTRKSSAAATPTIATATARKCAGLERHSNALDAVTARLSRNRLQAL